MRFHASNFFDLTQFEHAQLFEGLENVWDVLGDPLKNFCSHLSGRTIEGEVMEGAHLMGDGIYIGEGAVVEPGALIKGPCYIGRNAEIRHGAYIRGNVIVGEGAVVGHSTEVKNSIFLDEAKAGHFAYVGDSVLGKDANLGAGTKLANLKIIPGNVVLNIDGEKLDSGRRKFGAILGDKVELGCNSVTSPGTILASGSMVYPCIGVRGVFLRKTVLRESNMVLKRKQNFPDIGVK